MNLTLAASLRPQTGKGAARKLRAIGKIPAVMYGPGFEAQPVAVDPDALIRIFAHTKNPNTLIRLDIDGAEVPVLVKALSRHPVTRQVLHADFYRVTAGRVMRFEVPVRPVGRPEGAKLGGRLRLIRRTLNVRCTYDKLPAAFEFDVTNMMIDDIIRVSQMEVPEGVEILWSDDFNVITVYGKKAEFEIEDADADAEPDAEGAEAEA